MMTYENDTLIIPEEYKKMTASELQEEKEKVLKELQSEKRAKKVVKENKNHIVFKF